MPSLCFAHNIWRRAEERRCLRRRGRVSEARRLAQTLHVDLESRQECLPLLHQARVAAAVLLHVRKKQLVRFLVELHSLSQGHAIPSV